LFAVIPLAHWPQITGNAAVNLACRSFGFNGAHSFILLVIIFFGKGFFSGEKTFFNGQSPRFFSRRHFGGFIFS